MTTKEEKVALKKQIVCNFWTCPLEYKTPELCFFAVKHRGANLAYVPVNLITPEMCLAAVKQNKRAFADVPKNLRTDEIRALAQPFVQEIEDDEYEEEMEMMDYENSLIEQSIFEERIRNMNDAKYDFRPRKFRISFHRRYY